MRWRGVVVDGLVAVVAFAVSAAVLATAGSVADGLRQPDVGAYALVAIYSASPMALVGAQQCL